MNAQPTHAAAIRAELARLRAELMDEWAAPNFNVERSLRLQVEIKRLLDRLRLADG